MASIRNSILGLYPTTKFFIVLFLAISVFIVPNLVYAYLILPLIFIVALLAGKGKPFSNLFFKGLITISSVIFLLQIFFYPGESILWEWKIFSITHEGVLFSLKLISRILVLGGASILFFQITKIKDFVYSLEKIGFSPKATYVFLSTFQIIPEMRSMAVTIMNAQKSRGVETDGNVIVRAKAFIPTIAPLILSSITSTEERSITLEARAFTVVGEKTRLYHLDKTNKDNIVRALLVILFIILVGWSFVL